MRGKQDFGSLKNKNEGNLNHLPYRQDARMAWMSEHTRSAKENRRQPTGSKKKERKWTSKAEKIKIYWKRGKEGAEETCEQCESKRKDERSRLKRT